MSNENNGMSLEDLAKEFDSIMGKDADKKDSTEKKGPSFKSSYDKLAKDNKEISDEFGGHIKKVIKAEKALKNKLETDGTDIVSHEEITRAHEKATLNEKLEIDFALVKKAFAVRGNSRKLEDGSVELTLDNLQEKNPKDYVNNEEYMERMTIGEPTIFYKTLTEKNWLGKEKETNQVEVVIVMNNSRHTDENTVVTMVVQHKGGKLAWGKGNPGLYSVKTMNDFIEGVEKTNSYAATAEEKVDAGELTIEAYQKLFAKQDPKKRSTAQYWRDHDKEVAQLPSDSDPQAGRKMAERKDIETHRKELLATLGENYTEQLQNLHNHQEKVLKQVAEKIGEIKVRNEKIRNDHLFKILTDLVREDPRKNRKTIATLKRELVDKHNVDEAYLKSLVGA